MKFSKPGATTYKVDRNVGIGVSYGPNSDHEVSVFSPFYLYN